MFQRWTLERQPIVNIIPILLANNIVNTRLGCTLLCKPSIVDVKPSLVKRTQSTYICLKSTLWRGGMLVFAAIPPYRHLYCACTKDGEAGTNVGANTGDW